MMAIWAVMENLNEAVMCIFPLTWNGEFLKGRSRLILIELFIHGHSLASFNKLILNWSNLSLSSQIKRGRSHHGLASLTKEKCRVSYFSVFACSGAIFEWAHHSNWRSCCLIIWRPTIKLNEHLGALEIFKNKKFKVLVSWKCPYLKFFFM